MSKRRYVLRSFLVALIAAVALYAAFPYLVQQYGKYQHRRLVEKVLHRIEEQRGREIPTAGKTLQQAAESMELT
jgi:hypothetical protein